MPYLPSRAHAAVLLFLAFLPRAEAEEVSVEADSLNIQGDQVTADGAVEAERGDSNAEAQRAVYDRSSQWLELFGDARVSEPGYCLQAPHIRLNTETELGKADSPKLHMLANDTWVLAEQLERYAPDRIRLDNAAYTACSPPEHPPWGIRSSTTYVNQETDFAHHLNARFEVGGVPLLYTPYFGHRTDDERHTGFLLPTLEVSGTRGTDVTVPFYWNIAPQMDATIGVRHMTRNGTMPRLQFRHLGPNIESRIEGEILPEDNTTGETRWRVEADQRGRLPGGIGYRLDAERVSDPEFISEFGSGVERGSQRFLTSSLELSRGLGSFRWWANFSHHQDLQDFNADDTLQELPRTSLRGEQPLPGPARLDLNSEYVYFFREEGQRNHRLFADPTLETPLRSRFGSLVPAAGVHWTSYQIQPGGQGASSRTETRTVPHFSLRATSQVQRTFAFEDLALRHVIEPELFYLYVSPRGQDDLPVLDTRSPPIRFNDLFDRNPRFSGIDRIGDANQLTTALSTRLDAKSGNERWEAASIRVGQIRFFRDREVTLPGQTPETRGFSNLFGELDLRPIPEVVWKTVAEYDPDRPSVGVNEMTNFQSQLTASPGPHRFRASYLLRNDFSGGTRRTTTEEVETSAEMAVAKRWSVFGTFRHSLRFDETLLQRIGFNYDACCYDIGLTLENRVLRRRAGGQEETTLFLTFSLRTLGSSKIGTDPGNLF